MVKIYEEYMAKVAVLLGADPRMAKLHMKQVMEFETNLAHVRNWMLVTLSRFNIYISVLSRLSFAKPVSLDCIVTSLTSSYPTNRTNLQASSRSLFFL